MGELTTASANVSLVAGYSPAIISKFTRGEKFFELSNHLGNVLATVSDKKIHVDGNADGVIDLYKADVVSASDYAPFGMMLQGRKYSSGLYRYGFNGKEQDKEVSSTTTYDYGFRIYNPAIARFLSVDPLTSSYPELTPYQFSGNSPITFIDLDGLEMAWKNPVTGEVKAAGPLSLPIGSRNSDGWVLFQSIRKTAVNTPAPNPPVYKPVIQQGSDNLASVKVVQSQQVVLRTAVIKPKVAYRITTVSADKRTEYEKQQSEAYALGVEQAKVIGQSMQTPEGQGGMALGLFMYSTARTPITMYEHGSAAVEDIQDGNYWGAAGNGLLLGLDIAPFLIKGSSAAAEGVDNIISRTLRVQKQVDEHIIGGSRLGTNSYLNSVDDATNVLNAAHNGEAKILSTNVGQNRAYVQYNNVTGYYNDNGVIIPTNKFLIKGGKSSTVIPIHPNSETYK